MSYTLVSVERQDCRDSSVYSRHAGGQCEADTDDCCLLEVHSGSEPAPHQGSTHIHSHIHMHIHTDRHMVTLNNASDYGTNGSLTGYWTIRLMDKQTRVRLSGPNPIWPVSLTVYTGIHIQIAGSVVVKVSDLWSTGCEFDSQPCTGGLVLGWVTVCG